MAGAASSSTTASRDIFSPQIASTVSSSHKLECSFRHYLPNFTPSYCFCFLHFTQLVDRRASQSASPAPISIPQLLPHFCFCLFCQQLACIALRFTPNFNMASRDIRQRALQKIAALSATSTSSAFEKSDLDRLCKACPSHTKAPTAANGYAGRSLAGRVPMVRCI